MCPLMLLECLLFVAAAPPEPSPIHLPTVRDTVPAPMPADAAVTLTPDVLYVFQSDVPCLTFTSPGGAVGVTKAPGPLTIHSKFADAPGEPRLQTFDKKYVYLVKSLKDGRDELIIVPVGATDEGAARRVTFQVGQMPQPPPGPGPKPPEPKPVVTSFRVIIGFESGVTVPQSVINIAHGRVVEEWLNANCTGGKSGWRRRDQNLSSENDPTMAKLWKAVQDAKPTTPFFAVEVNGQVECIPFEATPEAMVAKLQTYKGAK